MDIECPECGHYFDPNDEAEEDPNPVLTTDPRWIELKTGRDLPMTLLNTEYDTRHKLYEQDGVVMRSITRGDKQYPSEPLDEFDFENGLLYHLKEGKLRIL